MAKNENGRISRNKNMEKRENRENEKNRKESILSGNLALRVNNENKLRNIRMSRYLRRLAKYLLPDLNE